MDFGDILALLLAVAGTGGIGHTVYNAVKDRTSGRAQAEREATVDLLGRTRTAEDRADQAEAVEAWARDCMWRGLEHAREVRSLALAAGVLMADLPPWPEMPPRPSQAAPKAA